MDLFALRLKTGVFSRIFSSMEDVEAFVQEHGVIGAEVGYVQFVPLCSTRLVGEIEIPWQEGIGSLKDRLQLSGPGSEEPETDDGSMRASTEPEVGNTRGNKKRRKSNVFPGDGATSPR